jgi:hypothetical protein
LAALAALEGLPETAILSGSIGNNGELKPVGYIESKIHAAQWYNRVLVVVTADELQMSERSLNIMKEKQTLVGNSSDLTEQVKYKEGPDGKYVSIGVYLMKSGTKVPMMSIWNTTGVGHFGGKYKTIDITDTVTPTNEQKKPANVQSVMEFKKTPLYERVKKIFPQLPQLKTGAPQLYHAFETLKTMTEDEKKYGKNSVNREKIQTNLESYETFQTAPARRAEKRKAKKKDNSMKNAPAPIEITQEEDYVDSDFL